MGGKRRICADIVQGEMQHEFNKSAANGGRGLMICRFNAAFGQMLMEKGPTKEIFVSALPVG